MEHNDLTIVSVYGHNNGASALPSIKRSVTGPDALPRTVSHPHRVSSTRTRAETFTGEATGRNLFDVSAHQAPTVCMDGGMYFVSGVSFQPPSGHHLASRRT